MRANACTCSEKWRQLNPPSDHSPACLQLLLGSAGNSDHINTDGSLPIEDRIVESACRQRAEGRGVKRRVLVSFAQFFNVARRQKQSPIQAGPHGEYIMLLSAAGYLWITPSAELAEQSEAYKFEVRTELS